MTRPKIRKCDQGTAYAAALTAGCKVGPANATDAQLMAMFCEDVMPLMVGALSPRLVWEGAQKRGLTALQLHDLCHRKDSPRSMTCSSEIEAECHPHTSR